MLTGAQLAKYITLPQKGKITAEYVWIDGSNGVRSKSRVRIPYTYSSKHVVSARALYCICYP